MSKPKLPDGWEYATRQVRAGDADYRARTRDIDEDGLWTERIAWARRGETIFELTADNLDDLKRKVAATQAEWDARDKAASA